MDLRRWKCKEGTLETGCVKCLDFLLRIWVQRIQIILEYFSIYRSKLRSWRSRRSTEKNEKESEVAKCSYMPEACNVNRENTHTRPMPKLIMHTQYQTHKKIKKKFRPRSKILIYELVKAKVTNKNQRKVFDLAFNISLGLVATFCIKVPGFESWPCFKVQVPEYLQSGRSRVCQVLGSSHPCGSTALNSRTEAIIWPNSSHYSIAIAIWGLKQTMGVLFASLLLK